MGSSSSVGVIVAMALSQVVNYSGSRYATVSLSQNSGFYPPFTHYFSIIAIMLRLGYNSSMARTAMIRARTEPDLKADVEGIFKDLGLSATETINLFYRQVRLKKGLPFDVKITDKIAREAINTKNKVDALYGELARLRSHDLSAR